MLTMLTLLMQVVDDIDDWMRCLVLNKDASKLVGATRESSLSVFDVSTGKVSLCYVWFGSCVC